MTASSHKHEPRSHWSADYVEHLRTVHFTLVVVCLALVVLITSDRKSAVSKARAELNGIRSVVRNWDRDWVAKEAERVFTGSKLPYAQLPAEPARSQIELAIPKGKAQVFNVVYDGPNWMLNAPDDSLFSPILSNYPLTELQPPPSGLQEFHRFWDLLAKGLQFEVPVELADAPLAFYGSEPGKARFVSGRKAVVPVPLRVRLSIKQLATHPGGSIAAGFYGSDWRAPFGNTRFRLGSVIVIPVKRSETVYLDPYPRFVPANSGWRREPFNDAFPNLSAVTKNYEELDLDTVDKILEGEESRAGDSFEAIGIKFPAEGVTRWGLVLILGIQLYLFLHLDELGPKLKPTDEGWEVAWIGVYKSHLARVLYFASSVLMPATAAFALAWHMPNQTRAAWWLRLAAMILGTALSLLLGSLAWRKLRKNSA
jgi:hypothetical protein